MIAREVVWMTTTFWSDYVSPAKAQRRQRCKENSRNAAALCAAAPLREKFSSYRKILLGTAGEIATPTTETESAIPDYTAQDGAL